MRTLYHFPLSPFSRRTRLALAHKGLACDLKDAREDTANRVKAARHWPLRTIPVFVDEDGTSVGDSSAICRYLDVAYPERPIWPSDRDSARAALEITALVDGALNLIVDTGTRYFALHSHTEWSAVVAEQMGRAQGAMDRLAQRAAAREGRALTEHGWSAADMWLYTFAFWVEGLPARAPTNKNIEQVLTLPWKLPAEITRWAAPFRERADVRALG